MFLRLQNTTKKKGKWFDDCIRKQQGKIKIQETDYRLLVIYILITNEEFLIGARVSEPHTSELNF